MLILAMLERYSHEQSATKAFISFTGPHPSGSHVSRLNPRSVAGLAIHTA